MWRACFAIPIVCAFDEQQSMLLLQVVRILRTFAILILDG